MRRKRVFRRKRRIRGSQGTWFPTAGATWPSGEGDDFFDATITDQTGNVHSEKSTGPIVTVHPVTQDYTIFPGGSAGESTDLRPTLRDYTEGQDYLLKRLVGNLVVFVDSSNPDPQGTFFNPAGMWTHVQVAAGFFVARASDADQSLPDLTEDEVDPLSATNSQNSWIWRRTWILDNPMNTFDENAADPTLRFQFDWDQASNRQLDAVTGPHFDTKSRRRIKREERLWLSLSAIGWDGGRASVELTDNFQPFVKFNADIRLFGKMMRGRTSSTF